MPRVAHLVTGLTTGGMERTVAKLAPRLAALGIRQRVLVLGDVGPPAAELVAAGIPVERLAMPGLPRPAGLRRLAVALSASRCDVIQAWLYRPMLLGAVLGLRPGSPPVLWNVRQSLTAIERDPPLSRAIVRVTAALAPRVAGICYNSALARTQHEALGYPVRLGRVIANGFDTARFRPDAGRRAAARAAIGAGPDDVVIGIAARFHPLKDFPTFCAALGRLAAAQPRIRWVLMGPGLDAANGQLAALLAGLPAERVHLLGERSEPELVMAGWDIATLSSAGEAFPNALGEAMACAVPCVATDVGACRELLAGSGSIVPSRDPAALAAAWGAMASLPTDQRRALGEAARRRIERDYGLGACAAAFAGWYAAIARRR